MTKLSARFDKYPDAHLPDGPHCSASSRDMSGSVAGHTCAGSGSAGSGSGSAGSGSAGSLRGIKATLALVDTLTTIALHLRLVELPTANKTLLQYWFQLQLQLAIVRMAGANKVRCKVLHDFLIVLPA